MKAAEGKQNTSDFNQNDEDLLVGEVVTEKLKEKVVLDESTIGIEPEVGNTVVSHIVNSTELKQENLQVNSYKLYMA